MISRSSRLLHAALVATCGAGIVYAPARAQPAFSFQVGQPGYYGQINVGNLAPPPVYDRRPVIVRPGRGRNRWNQTYLRPVYLRVPPYQARDWRRYCDVYQACSVPVQFVRDDWYRNVYAPGVRAAAARDGRERWRYTRPAVAPAFVAPPGRGWYGDDRWSRDRD